MTFALIPWPSGEAKAIIQERITLKDQTLFAGYAKHNQRYAFAAQYCTDRRVLDAGCGTGYGSVFLITRGAVSVMAIDISDECWPKRIVPTERYNLRFIKGDVGTACRRSQTVIEQRYPPDCLKCPWTQNLPRVSPVDRILQPWMAPGRVPNGIVSYVADMARSNCERWEPGNDRGRRGRRGGPGRVGLQYGVDSLTAEAWHSACRMGLSIESHLEWATRRTRSSDICWVTTVDRAIAEQGMQIFEMEESFGWAQVRGRSDFRSVLRPASWPWFLNGRAEGYPSTLLSAAGCRRRASHRRGERCLFLVA